MVGDGYSLETGGGDGGGMIAVGRVHRKSPQDHAGHQMLVWLRAVRVERAAGFGLLPGVGERA